MFAWQALRSFTDDVRYPRGDEWSVHPLVHRPPATYPQSMKKILLILMLAALALPVLADTLAHSSGFELWAPDEWTRAELGDQLALISPDGFAQMLVSVSPTTQTGVFQGTLEEQLGDVVTAFQVTTGPQDLTLNGLNGRSIRGQGSVDGVAVDCSLAVFRVKNSDITIVQTCHSKSMPEHEPMMDRILASLKSN
jgi:hypothetical protein